MRLVVPTFEGAPEARVLPTRRWYQSADFGDLPVVQPEWFEHPPGWAPYFDRLGALWGGKEVFAIMEHDIVPDSVDTIVGLAKCIEPLCAVPYEGHQQYWPPDRGRPAYAGTSCSAGKCDPGFMAWATACAQCGALREITPFDRFAVRAGFGLIKFSPLLTNLVPWKAPSYPEGGNPDGHVWDLLEHAITDGGRFPYRVHIHWPGGVPGARLVHRHYKCAGDV